MSTDAPAQRGRQPFPGGVAAMAGGEGDAGAGRAGDGFLSKAPGVSLPKGGGAIRGIGEKFAANPATGTGAMSVPIAASPGRSGFGPQLALAYDSGAGNGPFGFGWGLSLPAISRKTDKGLPRYLDGGGEHPDSDVFLLSGAEDLVPLLVRDGQGDWTVEAGESADGRYAIRRYRPRIEAAFARIERWTRREDPADVHWRSISRDNVLTLYGLDAESRIADPLDPARIFSWLVCETRDARGNAVLYRYKAEDGAGVDLALACERNRGPRDDPRRGANRYPKRILYGNREPLLDETGARPLFLDPERAAGAGWMFELVFDYGEHDRDAPAPDDDRAGRPGGGPVRAWPLRPDPFSSYRAGFELRTQRLCRRALMFHHFPGEAGVGRDCLVRSTDFHYAHEAGSPDAHAREHAFLRSVEQVGYRRDAGGYARSGLPPVEFRYSEPAVQERVREVDPESLENLPAGLDGSAWRWTDLHGEGIPGILAEQAGGWFYKRNLSPLGRGPADGEASQARFAPLEAVACKPNLALAGGAGFMDLAGDGTADVVVLDGPMPGLHRHDAGEGWEPFRPLASRPVRDLRDPELRFIDLDGDGRADLLVTEQDALAWHPSLGEDGFGPARRVAWAVDEEAGPRVLFSDAGQAIHLADMSGDGLADIVRIRNGEACYWPNLGHGRFGARIAMDHAPWLDDPDQFDPARIRLADIDGSGATDLVYLHRDGVRLYFNRSGNGWSGPRRLDVFPRPGELASIALVDLLGNGTACLVWSSPLPGDAPRPMRYVDLMGGCKPYLLVGVDNNLGAETRIRYAPSTRFYLQDRRDGRPWVTRLPFPVQVVERVETWDHVGRNRFATRYAYHHGYYDGVEREFRGFGMVEQWDTAEFAALGDGLPPAANADPGSHVPPVHTRTWFHTGCHPGAGAGSDRLAGIAGAGMRSGYFREPGLDEVQARALSLPGCILPDGLDADGRREASRALKGSMLRQEVYAGDAGLGAPYTVVEHDFAVRVLQPRAGGNHHAVFLAHARETLDYRYECDPSDPRIRHTLVLEVDDHGNVLKQATAGYGRRPHIRVVDAGGQVREIPNPGMAGLEPEDRARQAVALIGYAEHRFTAAVGTEHDHLAPLPCETRAFELTGYAATGPAGRFRAEDLVEADPAVPGRMRHRFADEVAYEDAPTASPCRRIVEWSRILYRRDDLTGLLPLGDLQPLALAGESYRLAFTPGLLASAYRRPRAGQAQEALLPDPGGVLAGPGGYQRSQALKADGRFPADDADDHWWAPSGRTFLSAGPADAPATERAQACRHFFLARRYRDPFGHDAFVDFDAHDLLLAATRDALDNRTVVEAHDYRALQPSRVRDANGNRSEVAFDAQGQVAGTAVMGKAAPAVVEGDSLDGFAADLPEAAVAAFFDAADPGQGAAALLGDATSRIVHDLDRFRRTRLAHPDDPARWEPACIATLARETHASAPLPPHGLRIQLGFAYSDGFGRQIQSKIQAEPGPLAEGGTAVVPRWVGSGWTILDNKGRPVREYEPFFSAGHGFEFEVLAGVSPVLFRDPAGRVVAVLRPDHAYEKVRFGAWRQVRHDANDTCAARAGQTGDPRTDPDIAGDVAAYFAAQPDGWRTWHAQRADGALGEDERNAAARAAAHAGTPSTAHLDPFGRSFLTVAGNRIECPGHELDGSEEECATRLDLDIAGNTLAVRDAVVQAGDRLGRIVVRQRHDLLGNRIHQASMEAGPGWQLHDVAGRPVLGWDARGHVSTLRYDALGRLLQRSVRGTIAGGDAASDPRTLGREIVVERIEYGESLPGAEALNLRTRVYRHFDAAGVRVNARLDDGGAPVQAYDFKGNLLRSTRRLVVDPTSIPDWSADPPLESERFEAGTRYDALDRPVQSIAPRSSLGRGGVNVVQQVFNEANLLERVDVWLQRADEPVALLDPAVEAPSPVGVAAIDYDARGRRLRIDYRNGASTACSYDPPSGRLVRLQTRRAAADFPGDDPQPPVVGWGGRQLQDLHYTYDPVGNITRIRDDAQQAVFFRNRRVDPGSDYVYDARYRLVQADGREHLGQGAAPLAHSHDDGARTGLPHPGDGNAMGRYAESYVYDAVGNLLRMRHRGADPAQAGWTRDYAYAEPSLIEDGASGAPRKTCNRLSATTLDAGGAAPQPEAYLHDAAGNMLRMPHLGGGAPGPNLHWDHDGRLHRADLGGGGTAWYVYDASGERVRKVWEKSPGLTEERIYLGGFEVFRRHQGPVGSAPAVLERETLHVMDGERRIALVETRTLDASGSDRAPRRSIRYQCGNHLGSASLELDERAQIESYEEYAPYGSSTYQATRSQTETAKRYRYTGKERDREIGLYYHGARYYAPWIGRWVSADPIGIADGVDVFAYSQGNPVLFRDPTGTQTEQMELIESIKIPTVALRGEFAYYDEIGEFISAEAHSWNLRPSDYVRGHSANTPHWSSPAGREQTVSPQTAVSNARQSVQERADAQAARQRNLDLRAEGKEGPLEFLREDRKDLSAEKRMKHGHKLPADVKEKARKYDSVAADDVRRKYLSRNDAMEAALKDKKPVLLPSGERPVQMELAEAKAAAGGAGKGGRVAAGGASAGKALQVAGTLLVSAVTEAGHGQRPYGWEDEELDYYLRNLFAGITGAPSPEKPRWMAAEEAALSLQEAAEAAEKTRVEEARLEFERLYGNGAGGSL